VEKLLAGKRAIVTGSGQGLGSAIAGALAADGARLLVISRSAEKVEAVVQGIKRQGGEAFGVQEDLADPDAADRVIQAALDRFAGVDILVNNAGVFVWRKLLEFPREDWDRTIATNLSAPYFLIQAAGRVMARQGQGGAIVNVGSIHSRVAEAEVVAHCAAKFGLIGLTQAAAAALREHDVRVNAICPGSIEPESADRRGSSPREKVTQADIASLTVYLVSDLSRSITGSIIDAFGSTRIAIKI
jgi:NAD(P)-dependent dehydrogenase (short-subunit alcohol dehydrogenase family)